VNLKVKYKIKFYFSIWVICFILFFGLLFYRINITFWIKIIVISFNLNSLNMIFIICVLTIRLIIFFYSFFYLKSDISLGKYLLLILYFMLSILVFIIRENLYSIYIGWDNLGISSYLLIAYYNNKNSLQSAIITIMRNRVGDFIFLRIIVYLIYRNMNVINLYLSKFLSFFLFFLFLTKRAIFPFSSWLPFAIRAPTPTSSLVHSSTLVTSGLFLIIKFYYFINFQYLIILCLLVSIITLILSGLNSLIEIDFKKIVAFSTLIQISFILLTLVINLIRFSYFHILSHAFFKSLLFLIVGILIHRNFSQQDFRIFFKGNNICLNIIITVSLLSLIGLIFFSGFYRKDLILEKFFLIKIRFLLLIIIYISIIISFFYSFLLIINQNFFKNKVTLYYSSFSYFQTLPFFLFIISILFRKFFFWNFFKIEVIFISFLKKILILFYFIFSILLFTLFRKNKNLAKLFNKNFYLDNFIFLFNSIFYSINIMFKKLFEKRFLELLENKIFVQSFFNIKFYILENKMFLFIFILFILVFLFLY